MTPGLSATINTVNPTPSSQTVLGRIWWRKLSIRGDSLRHQPLSKIVWALGTMTTLMRLVSARFAQDWRWTTIAVVTGRCNIVATHLTSRTVSFLMLTRLLKVLVGSLSCGAGYGNWRVKIRTISHLNAWAFMPGAFYGVCSGKPTKNLTELKRIQQPAAMYI